MAQRLEDHDLMPYGKYKGTKMANVPAGYLLYCDRNGWLTPSVENYVRRNYELLLKEQQDEEDKKARNR